MWHLILPVLAFAIVCWLIVFVLDRHTHHFVWLAAPSGDLIEACSKCGTGRTLVTRRQLIKKEAPNG